MIQDKAVISIFWFRRDLRLEDNHGLYYSLQQPHPVLPIFIFDKLILRNSSDRKDKRVSFIHQLVSELSRELAKWGSSLYIAYGEPTRIFEELLGQFTITGVVANQDFEPYAIARDQQIRTLLSARDIPFHTYKDQVLFDPREILSTDGSPYVVYTPYSREWKRRLSSTKAVAYPSETYLHKLWKHPAFPIPGLQELGFEPVTHGVAPIRLNRRLLQNYAETRDLPSVEGTSNASPHLRFGTVSVRHLAGLAIQLSDTWLNELIWREFFIMILFHFPHVVKHPFQRQYDTIVWRNNPQEFKAWCEGNTGYPLVDAGMRQLNATGFMHNRVRMVTASFLTKHLLIDWRWGEAYFAEKLLDYELSSNNGNWQLAVGCGCDATSCFRICNPNEQAQKFDFENRYITTWIPNFPIDYPQPIVGHAFARQRAFEAYKRALG